MTLTAVMDQTALATWAGVFVMILVAVIGWWISSMKGVGKIDVKLEQQNTAIAKNHGENVAAIGKVETKIENLSDWLESVAKGNSPHIAEIHVRLDQHDHQISDQGKRLTSIEMEHARYKPSCETRKTGEK